MKHLKPVFHFCSTGTAHLHKHCLGRIVDKIVAGVGRCDILIGERREQIGIRKSSERCSIDNQRISISGVDEDEEAVSLVKFQNAYTLASKMIQTLTEVYDQLILRTGV